MLTRLTLLTVALLLAQASPGEASLEKLLVRRQAEPEREATTASSSKPPERLYPDLPQPPSPSNQPPMHHGSHHFPRPTPFVPFGLPPPSTIGSRLDNPLGDPLNPYRPAQQARPVSPMERMQSQSFTSGLGRRLLSMLGIESPPSDSANGTQTVQASPAGAQPSAGIQEAMKALRNSTVLQQLNNGVQSIYGGLGKMYNSTVQQQLDLLQERIRQETGNSTNPWQQQMAQQIPMYFKSVAAKVEGAQESLNRLWQQMVQANNGSLDKGAQGWQPSSRGLFGSVDQMMGPNGAYGDSVFQPGNFFDQIGRSFGFGAQPADRAGANAAGQDRANDLGAQLTSFWHNQVQPQVSMLRGQIMRTWRDLTSSGVYAPEQVYRTRMGGNGNGLGAGQARNSSEIVDSILESVDMSGSEYSLLEPTGDQQANGSSSSSNLNSASSNVANQIQTRLTSMQRDVNQLWLGLSGALQGALANVQNSINPRPQVAPAAARDEDPAANEIDTKIKDLSSLQRDADVVFETIQQRQRQQQQQEMRPSIGDRFRGFFNNVELEQLPNRVGDSFSRFGTVMGDLWAQIPERWNGFVQNLRPIEDSSPSARLKAADGSSSSTTTTTTTSSSVKPANS